MGQSPEKHDDEGTDHSPTLGRCPHQRAELGDEGDHGGDRQVQLPRPLLGRSQCGSPDRCFGDRQEDLPPGTWITPTTSSARSKMAVTSATLAPCGGASVTHLTLRASTGLATEMGSSTLMRMTFWSSSASLPTSKAMLPAGWATSHAF